MEHWLRERFGRSCRRQSGSCSCFTGSLFTKSVSLGDYSISVLRATTAINGSHTIYAKAYDSSGNVGTSSVTTVTVYNAPGDTIPPTISLTSPANGTTYTNAQTATVSANASDNVGVTKVEFYDNGSLKSTDTTSPYSYS